MKLLKKLEANLEEYILGVFLIGMAVILFVQIIMRTLFSQSLTWAEEVARYMYVWSVFLSISYTIRRGNILRVDLVEQHLPETLRKLLRILLKLIDTALYGFLFWNSLAVVKAIRISGQTSPALELPMVFVYLIIPIGFALATIRAFQSFGFELFHRQKAPNRQQAQN